MNQSLAAPVTRNYQIGNYLSPRYQLDIYSGSQHRNNVSHARETARKGCAAAFRDLLKCSGHALMNDHGKEALL